MNGGEGRREGNQHIRCLLHARNNVVLNPLKSSEERTYDSQFYMKAVAKVNNCQIVLKRKNMDGGFVLQNIMI